MEGKKNSTGANDKSRTSHEMSQLRGAEFEKPLDWIILKFLPN